MKNIMTTVATMLFFLTSAHALEIDCTISYNAEPVSHMRVATEMGQKVLINQVEGVSAYITQKSETFFSLEAFVADYDIRGYSEGILSKSTDKLNFSLWGRASLTDISCTLAKK